MVIVLEETLDFEVNLCVVDGQDGCEIFKGRLWFSPSLTGQRFWLTPFTYLIQATLAMTAALDSNLKYHKLGVAEKNEARVGAEPAQVMSRLPVFALAAWTLPYPSQCISQDINTQNQYVQALRWV